MSTHKALREQVLVVVGASSGIGLVTARRAAERGACVVLAARNGDDLRQAVDGIRRAGGRAIAVEADVAERDQVERIASEAVREFSRIDTWINNAAVAVYGKLTEVPIEDMRRQFDINYWGQVYGSLAAVPHLRRSSGTLINVASALSDRAIPLQGNYCAAKHALKAFTDTLRMELEAEGAPISVSLVKPASVDTPLFDKARTYLGFEPQPVPPVYAPEVVADAMLECAERPVREVITGGAGKLLSLASRVPRLADRYMERPSFGEAQQTDIPASGRADNLYEPVTDDGGERSRNWRGRTKGTSAYTFLALRPGHTVVAASGVAAALALGVLLRRQRDDPQVH